MKFLWVAVAIFIMAGSNAFAWTQTACALVNKPYCENVSTMGVAGCCAGGRASSCSTCMTDTEMQQALCSYYSSEGWKWNNGCCQRTVKVGPYYQTECVNFDANGGAGGTDLPDVGVSCSAGEYKDSDGFCQPCPQDGRSAGGDITIIGCYLDGDFENDSGSGNYVNNCYYKADLEVGGEVGGEEVVDGEDAGEHI